MTDSRDLIQRLAERMARCEADYRLVEEARAYLAQPESELPGLKKQALTHFESFAATFETSGGDSDLIRRALEQLDD